MAVVRQLPRSASHHMLNADDWTVACQGHWKRDEHIVHLEARVLVKSMEVAVENLSVQNARQLFLVDSMSAALAFGRCRSRNYRMLRQVRKFCSMAEVNPADELSFHFN